MYIFFLSPNFIGGEEGFWQGAIGGLFMGVLISVMQRELQGLVEPPIML
jgi:hypothetical protein